MLRAKTTRDLFSQFALIEGLLLKANREGRQPLIRRREDRR